MLLVTLYHGLSSLLDFPVGLSGSVLGRYHIDI
jgi:hypothetical protein